MKITQIETKVYEDKLLPQLFVSITTDVGLQGIGEAWYGLPVKPIESAINHALAPLLIGEDSSRIEFLWRKMYKYAYRYGTEGILLCAPVAHLLGGIVRNSLKAYASLPPLRKEKLLIEQINSAVAAGFAGVKLHEVDVDLVAAARRCAPDGFPLMLDVNGHWAPLEAEEQAKRLEDYDLIWLEEPVWPMQDHKAMARVREKVSIRFAAGENEYTLGAFDRLMTSGAVEYVQPEISKIGGLSTARKISALADLHNAVICPHAFRIGPALYASIHWALTQTNMAWLEIPWLPEGYAFPSGVPMPKIVNGEMGLPDAPGLGVTL